VVFYLYELAQIPYFDTVLPVDDHSKFDQSEFRRAGFITIEQGMVSEYLNDEEQALDSFCDALLVEEENPELNKNIENYYLSTKVLVKAILHWARYRETSPQGKEYLSTQERQNFCSHQLKMKSLPKQNLGLSHE
jgi:hypothetical protein